jgi:hypothetical protein
MLPIRRSPAASTSRSSLKAGIVAPSVMLRKLAAYRRQNQLDLALQELGRIERTCSCSTDSKARNCPIAPTPPCRAQQERAASYHRHPLTDSYNQALFQTTTTAPKDKGHRVAATDPYREQLDPVRAPKPMCGRRAPGTSIKTGKEEDTSWACTDG